MTLNVPLRPAKRRFRPSRNLLIGAGLLAVLVVGGIFWATRDKAPKDPYRTAAVERGTISRTVSASGVLEPLITVDVGSQISGQILRVLVDFNDVVKRGQVLAELDPQTYETRVAQGRADIVAGQAGVATQEAALKQAQAELAAAKADYDRKRVLVDKGFYAPTTMDQAEAAYRRAAAGVDSARAQIGAQRARVVQSQAALRTQQVDLGRTTIVAPIDGVIVDRQIEPGQTVAASLQAPILFRIAQDLSKVEVKISVDEADIGQVREGQTVRFTVDAFPDDNFTGVVTQVRKQPVTESNVTAYVVMAQADNPQGKLLPGMTANADILLEERKGVLRAPAAALRWTPGGTARPAPTMGPPGFGGGGPPGGGFGGGQGGQRRQGGGMMNARNIAQQLDLDAGQQKKAEAILTAAREKGRAAMSAGGDRSAMREAMRKNMQAALSQIEPILRADQKPKLAALKAQMAAGGQGFTSGAVWVLRDGKPAMVQVRVGATDGSFTEVRSPDLKPGDEVITGGGPKTKAQAPASPFGAGGGGPPGGGARGRT